MVQFEVPNPNYGTAEQNGKGLSQIARQVIIVAEEEDSDDERDIIPGPPNGGGAKVGNIMDLSNTRGSMDDSENRWKGNGMLASRKDLNMPAAIASRVL